MHNFKVGDVVVCVDNSGRELHLTEGRQYTVTLATAGFLYMVDNSGRGGIYRFNRFELCNPKDGELPPAPTSVSYREACTGNLFEARIYEYIDGSKGIHIYTGRHHATAGGVVFDADEVLQLAHDLTRMAMQLKRELKK
jgi:hypothetical protein